MAMQDMYPAANTIIVQLLEDITAAVDEITVTDASAFPAAPNFATIGTDNNAEVIVYQGIDLGNNKLTGCLRGQSYTVARAWATGAFIYHSWTAQLANNMMANIDYLKENKVDKDGTYTKTETDQLLAQKINKTSLVSGGHASAFYALPTGTYMADNNVEDMPFPGSWWFVTNIRYTSGISMLEATSTGDVSICYRASWVNEQWSGWKQVAFV